MIVTQNIETFYFIVLLTIQYTLFTFEILIETLMIVPCVLGILVLCDSL